MNNNFVLCVPLALFLSACTTEGPVRALNCDIYTPPASCAGDPNAPAVHINVTAKTFNPPNACGGRGNTITFSLTPVAGLNEGDTAIIPKDPTKTWLTGTNSPDRTEIVIKIPDWATVGPADYALIRSNGDCVDPRIDVE